MPEKKEGKTIFHQILLPLLSVLIFEIVFMAATILVGGVTERLDKNAMDMLAQQTENRGSYLLNDMIANWSNLDMLSEEIDSRVQGKLEQKQLSLEDLTCNGSECTELLADINTDLIDTMYSRQISGIFVIFHMEGTDIPETLPGVYIRDLDPAAAPSQRNADLLWERAPTGLVRSSHIATDTGWQPVFSREDSVEKDFFSKPFETACQDERNLSEKEYGYWTVTPYCLSGDRRTAISYSIPLVLEDGTVYGVLGIELLTDYMQTLLPDVELLEEKQGSYLLAVGSEEEKSVTPVVLSSDTLGISDIEKMQIALQEDGNAAEDADGDYYAAVKPLVLYSNHAPFDSDKWYLMGIGPKNKLFAFSRQIQTLLFLSIAFTFVVGLLGILYASFRLSKPIRRLSEEVAKARKDNRLPLLSATGIIEIDQFADSISSLEQEVVESSTRFLSIMDMASVELAGYELQTETGNVYVTDNYFVLLGAQQTDVSHLTVDEFLEKQSELEQLLEHFGIEDGSVVYTVPQADGSVRYFRSEKKEENGRQIGLIEDVTSSTLEKKRIENERDRDSLTGLYSRSGFRREADNLFLQPDKLKHAGLLMIDLDNLKTTNDRFGHNFGDRYIQTAGQCFVDNTPENTLCARISGDEFLVLFYGYDNIEEVRKRIKGLYQAIHELKFILPNGDNMGLSASGGVAWYPKDSQNLSELMKYADFAMYQVKRSKKGRYKEFNPELYRQKQDRDISKLELNEVLKTRNIDYFFQPIFDAKNGEAYGYEALMRVNTPMLRSPDVVLRLAKEEGWMHEIEVVTMFRSAECYEALLAENLVRKEALLFVNSIANECMTEEEEREYHERHHKLQDRIVIEITETENMDLELVKRKNRADGFHGMFALDDYGSGYNSELNLLDLKPNFIKIDISIVRDIDKDVSKQHMVSNVVSYAHERNMLIIAEGLETAEELKTTLELGVDLVQGYYLARPAKVPESISKEALAVILCID